MTVFPNVEMILDPLHERFHQPDPFRGPMHAD